MRKALDGSMMIIIKKKNICFLRIQGVFDRGRGFFGSLTNGYGESAYDPPPPIGRVLRNAPGVLTWLMPLLCTVGALPNINGIVALPMRPTVADPGVAISCVVIKKLSKKKRYDFL